MPDQELLAVLDLPEDKQLIWLKEHREEFGIDNHPASYPLEGFPRACRFFLCDLAFRLRQEAKKKNEGAWLLSCWEILEGELNLTIQYGHGQEAEAEILRKGPIHWIVAALNSEHIAALIAKEQK